MYIGVLLHDMSRLQAVSFRHGVKSYRIVSYRIVLSRLMSRRAEYRRSNHTTINLSYPSNPFNSMEEGPGLSISDIHPLRPSNVIIITPRLLSIGPSLPVSSRR
jgi:hypothetical protein